MVPHFADEEIEARGVFSDNLKVLCPWDLYIWVLKRVLFLWYHTAS